MPTAQRLGVMGRLLLLAGVVSPIAYIAEDQLSASQYPGYSIMDQAISELSAIGAPTARLWSMLSPVYGILIVAFTVGVLRASRHNRRLRVPGALLLLLTLAGPIWGFFPMHQRGTVTTWQDTGHLVMGAFSVATFTAIIGFGAFALERRFREYSLVVMVIVFLSGAATFAYVSRVAAGQPTPWLGLIERVSVYGSMIWTGVFAMALLGEERHPSSTKALAT